MMISELVLGMYTCFCTSITQVLYEVLYEYCTIICISTVRALYEYCAKSLYEYYPNTAQLEPGMTRNYWEVTALGRVIGTACTTLLDAVCRDTSWSIAQEKEIIAQEKWGFKRIKGINALQIEGSVSNGFKEQYD